jgi:hypothetical protein
MAVPAKMIHTSMDFACIFRKIHKVAQMPASHYYSFDLLSTAMKILSRLFFLCLAALSPMLLVAQCATPTIPSNSFLLGAPNTDSLLGDPATSHYICVGTTLYYADTGADTIYMGGSSTLVVLGCRDLVLYMNANCTLVIDSTTSSAKHIRKLVLRPIFAHFQDSSLATIDSLETCFTLAYDFSQFAGGADPCAALAAPAPAGASDWSAYPNPVLHALYLEAPPQGKPGSGRLVNAWGVEVGRAVLLPGQTSTLDLSRLPSGIYTLLVQQGEEWTTRKVVKQ